MQRWIGDSNYPNLIGIWQVRKFNLLQNKAEKKPDVGQGLNAHIIFQPCFAFTGFLLGFKSSL